MPNNVNCAPYFALAMQKGAFSQIKKRSGNAASTHSATGVESPLRRPLRQISEAPKAHSFLVLSLSGWGRGVVSKALKTTPIAYITAYPCGFFSKNEEKIAPLAGVRKPSIWRVLFLLLNLCIRSFFLPLPCEAGEA